MYVDWTMEELRDEITRRYGSAVFFDKKKREEAKEKDRALIDAYFFKLAMEAVDCWSGD